MAGPLILSIDQGTSSTKCLLVDEAGSVVAHGQAPVSQSTPRPGWVEQDPIEIWESVRRAVAATLPREQASRVAAVALSTQRESCLIWDRRGGEALTPVLSWQDQRTEGLCAVLRERAGALVRAKSGLPLDPMFSAVKAKWLLDQIDPDRRRARAGELCAGTVDSFLLSRFGGDAIVEAGNASRMQLVDLDAARFGDELLAVFDLPAAVLPRIVLSTGPFPGVRDLPPLPDGVPIKAVMADSHAALFAHGAFTPGPVKATHGTGSSIMGLLGEEPQDELHPGICRTLAWWIDRPVLAFEGNIRSAGSSLVWAAGLLGIEADALAGLAAEVADAGAVHLVPAFNGLGAPWWDAEAIAVLCGFTLGTGREVIARAALDSIAHQIADVVDAVRSSGAPVDRLHVDGGPTRNDQLMQFEADMVGVPVVRAETAELSALGAAHLAGLAEGIFTLAGLAGRHRSETVFSPEMPAASRRGRREAWARALQRARWRPGGRT